MSDAYYILFLGTTLVKRNDTLDTKNVNFDFLQDIFIEEAWKSIDKIDAFFGEQIYRTKRNLYYKRRK